ncbi:hypothetical protein NBRC10512_005145 [Rhodotorula toruloides]|uniref:RHTO0S02e14158g1_1 n=2 Tax=Rhodotorula toruloides TaxID=5286 RepID=A0A061AJR4_RHOTO|nr:serine/threonine-protein kinase-like protein [Rhodotorula toruloides NP11]EMS23419.1 serine/threonine-protein kinase-like protein [Rhodotorula toruloides NP11]CDR37382.1 RHTO0S02e14158g1_1 [Rhodotorula toruloides]
MHDSSAVDGPAAGQETPNQLTWSVQSSAPPPVVPISRVVPSVLPLVNSLVAKHNRQSYFNFADLPSPVHSDRHTRRQNDPLAPCSPRLFSSPADAHTTREPLLSDVTVHGAVTQIVDGAHKMDTFVGDVIEALKPLRTWYGEDEPYIPTGLHFGRAEKDVEDFHRANDLERARHLAQALTGIPVAVAAVHPVHRVGSADLVLTTVGRVNERHIELRMEEKQESSAPTEVFEQFRLISENGGSDFYMAHKFRPPQQPTPSLLSLAWTPSPPATSSPSLSAPFPPSPLSSFSASPSSSSSSSSSHSPTPTSTPNPAPAYAPAITPTSASTASTFDFVVSEVDVSESLAHMDLGRTCSPAPEQSPTPPIQPAPDATLPPSVKQDTQQPKPADWLDWGWANRGGRPAPYERLDSVERHTLHIIQQIATQFGMAALKRAEARGTKKSSEGLRELYEAELRATSDFQLLQTPEQTLPLWREGTTLKVGRILTHHGEISRYTLAYFLLGLADALDLKGRPLARVAQLITRLQKGPLLSSLYPAATPSANTANTTNTTAASAPRSDRRQAGRRHNDSSGRVEEDALDEEHDPTESDGVGSSSDGVQAGKVAREKEKEERKEGDDEQDTTTGSDDGESSFESAAADLGASFFVDSSCSAANDGDEDLGESPPPASPKSEPLRQWLGASSAPASPDMMRRTSTLIIDGCSYERVGTAPSTTPPPSDLDASPTSLPRASPSTSAPAISLSLMLGRGGSGDVYTDSTGVFAVKLVEPRNNDFYDPIYDNDANEAIQRYGSRLQETRQEVEAYRKLQACAIVPAFYGLFERVDEDGYTNLALVMERVMGRHLAKEQLVTDVIKKIESAVRTVHCYGVLHGDIRLPNILLAHDKIFLLDFGRSRLDPSVRQAETETARIRHMWS